MHHALSTVLVSLLALPTLISAAALPRQQLLDVCANINVNLFTELGIVGDVVSSVGGLLGDAGGLLGGLGLKRQAPGDTALSGQLDVCLCLGALPLFISSNVVASAAAKVAGVGAVSAVLQALIDLGSGGQSCQYPPYSTQTCTSSDPCGFTCDTGYVLSDGSCVPITPNPPNGNGVGPSGQARRRSLAMPACRSSREMVCGVPGSGSQISWECVDVTADLESCGGCVFDAPFNGALFTPKGKDCTSIPHVADVVCAAGACNVLRCMSGFVPSTSRTSCVSLLSVASVASHVASVAYAMIEQRSEITGAGALIDTAAVLDTRQDLPVFSDILLDIPGLTEVTSITHVDDILDLRSDAADAVVAAVDNIELLDLLNITTLTYTGIVARQDTSSVDSAPQAADAVVALVDDIELLDILNTTTFAYTGVSARHDVPSVNSPTQTDDAIVALVDDIELLDILNATTFADTSVSARHGTSSIDHAALDTVVVSDIAPAVVYAGIKDARQHHEKVDANAIAFIGTAGHVDTRAQLLDVPLDAGIVAALDPLVDVALGAVSNTNAIVYRAAASDSKPAFDHLTAPA